MDREARVALRMETRGAGPAGRPGSLTALLAAALAATAAQAAPAPGREAWRKVEAGHVTVVGTASDPKLVETAVTLRALAAILPGLVPGAFGASPPIVVAVVHDASDLARVGLPSGSPLAGRIVLASTGEEDARPGLLRAAVVALGRRPKVPLPAWIETGLAEYASTFTASGTRATLGRVVPAHVALLRASRPDEELFTEPSLAGDDAGNALRRAGAWAVVHYLLHGTPDGARQIGRYLALLAEGRDAASAIREAFGLAERSLLEKARVHAVESRFLARLVPAPQGAPPSRILPLTLAGAAGVLGGVVRGRRAPVPGTLEVAGAAAAPSPGPVLGSAPSHLLPKVSRDVPAEVDAVNRLIDEGREEEALARLEALHASLARDPEMQRALGWDVQEVRRVVIHNRLVRRYNEAIGLLNAGRLAEAIAIFREVASKAEDPGLRRLAWERATAPDGGRR